MRYISRLVIGAGSITALSQVFTITPSPAVFGLGVLVALLGAVAYSDELVMEA